MLGLDAGERWLVREDAVLPWRDEPVDAVITCAAEDLAAMLAGRAPTGEVTLRQGDRDRPPRLRQARGVLALAALGWAGRWPDPAADPEHVALVREALYDLGLGPADARGPLFAGGPLAGLTVRVTDSASARIVVTEGLAGPCELAVALPPRVGAAAAVRPLRAAALFVHETGELPPARLTVGEVALTSGLHPAFARGLPLPHRDAWLVQVRPA